MVEKESLPNAEVFMSDQKVRKWQLKRSPGWSGLTESHCHCHYFAILNTVSPLKSWFSALKFSDHQLISLHSLSPASYPDYLPYPLQFPSSLNALAFIFAINFGNCTDSITCSFLTILFMHHSFLSPQGDHIYWRQKQSYYYLHVS